MINELLSKFFVLFQFNCFIELKIKFSDVMVNKLIIRVLSKQINDMRALGLKIG